MEATETPKSRLQSRVSASRPGQAKGNAYQQLYTDILQSQLKETPFLSYVDDYTAAQGNIFYLTHGTGVSSEQMYIQAAVDALNSLEKYDNSAASIIHQVLDYLFVQSQLKPQELDYLRSNVKDLQEENYLLTGRIGDTEAKKNYYYSESQAIKQRFLQSEDQLAKAVFLNQQLYARGTEQEEQLVILERRMAEMVQETQMAKHNFNISASRYTYMLSEMTTMRTDLEGAKMIITRKDAQLAIEVEKYRYLKQEIDKLNNSLLIESEKRKAAFLYHQDEMGALAQQLLEQQQKCYEVEEKLQKEQKRLASQQIYLQNYYARISAYQADFAYYLTKKPSESSFRDSVSMQRDPSCQKLPRSSIASVVKEQAIYYSSLANYRALETRDAKVQVNTLFFRPTNAAMASDQDLMDKQPIEQTISQISQSYQYNDVMEFSEFYDFTEINATAHYYEACFGGNYELKLTNTDMIAVKQYIQQYFIPKEVYDDVRMQFQAINCKYAKYKTLFYQLEMERNLNELKGRYDSIQQFIYNINQIMLQIPYLVDGETFKLMMQINDLKQTYIRDMTKNESRFFEFEHIFLAAKYVALELYYYYQQAENNRFIRSIERKQMSKEILTQTMTQLFETLKQFYRLPQLQHVKVSYLVYTLIPDYRNTSHPRFSIKPQPIMRKASQGKEAASTASMVRRNESSVAKLSRKNSIKSSKTAKFIIGQTSLADLLAKNEGSKDDKPAESAFLDQTPAYQKPLLMNQLAQLCESDDAPFIAPALLEVPFKLKDSLNTEPIFRSEPDMSKTERKLDTTDKGVMTNVSADDISELLQQNEDLKAQLKEITSNFKERKSKISAEESGCSDHVERLEVMMGHENASKMFEWQPFVAGQTQSVASKLPEIQETKMDTEMQRNSSFYRQDQREVARRNNMAIFDLDAFDRPSMHDKETSKSDIKPVFYDKSTSVTQISARMSASEEASVLYSNYEKCSAGRDSGYTRPDAENPADARYSQIAVQTEYACTDASAYVSDENVYICVSRDQADELAKEKELSSANRQKVNSSVYRAPVIENMQKPAEYALPYPMKINTLKDIVAVQKYFTASEAYTDAMLGADVQCQMPEQQLSFLTTAVQTAFLIEQWDKECQTFVNDTTSFSLEIDWKTLLDKKRYTRVSDLQATKKDQVDSALQFDRLDRELLLNKSKDHYLTMDPERLIKDDQMDKVIEKLYNRIEGPAVNYNGVPSDTANVSPEIPLSRVPQEPAKIELPQEEEIQKIINMVDDSGIDFDAQSSIAASPQKQNPYIIVKQNRQLTHQATRQQPRKIAKAPVVKDSRERFCTENYQLGASSVSFSKSLLEEERKLAFRQGNIGEFVKIMINSAPKQYAIENGRFISPFAQILSYRKQLKRLKQLYQQRIKDQRLMRAVNIAQDNSQRHMEAMAITQMQKRLVEPAKEEQYQNLLHESLIFKNNVLHCPLTAKNASSDAPLILIDATWNIIITTPIALRSLTEESVRLKQYVRPNDLAYWLYAAESMSGIVSVAYKFHEYLVRKLTGTNQAFVQLPPDIYVHQQLWLIRVIRTVYYELEPPDSPHICFSYYLGKYLLGKYGVKQMAARFIWQLLVNLYVYHADPTRLAEIYTFMLFLSDALDSNAYAYYWYCRKLLLPDFANPQNLTITEATRGVVVDRQTYLYRLTPFIPNVDLSMMHECVDQTLLQLLGAFCDYKRRVSVRIVKIFEKESDGKSISPQKALFALRQVNSCVDEETLQRLTGGQEINLAMFCRLYETVITPALQGSRSRQLRAKIEKTKELVVQKRVPGMDKRINDVYLLLYGGKYLDAQIQLDQMYDDIIVY